MSKTLDQFLAESASLTEEAVPEHDNAFSDFTKTHHEVFGGACQLPGGVTPKIHEGEHGVVIVGGHEDDPRSHVVSVLHGEDGESEHAQEFNHGHHAMEYAHKARQIIQKHGNAGTHAGEELEHHGFHKVR